MTDLVGQDFSPNITPDLSTVPSITPDQTPLLTNLPSSLTAYRKKYADPQLQSALANVSPSLRASLLSFDQSRVQRGQDPLSASQTILALQSAITNQPATPPESQGFFGRALSDVQSIVSEIPHLPFTLYNEATQLPEAPSKLQEVLGRGDIQDVIGGLREVPGLRLVPGVFTASQLAQGGPGALLQHPVMTALDILPYAKPGVSALADATLSRIPRVAEAAETIRAGLPDINETRQSTNHLLSVSLLVPVQPYRN